MIRSKNILLTITLLFMVLLTQSTVALFVFSNKTNCISGSVPLITSKTQTPCPQKHLQECAQKSCQSLQGELVWINSVFKHTVLILSGKIIFLFMLALYTMNFIYAVFKPPRLSYLH